MGREDKSTWKTKYFVKLLVSNSRMIIQPNIRIFIISVTCWIAYQD